MPCRSEINIAAPNEEPQWVEILSEYLELYEDARCAQCDKLMLRFGNRPYYYFREEPELRYCSKAHATSHISPKESPLAQ